MNTTSLRDKIKTTLLQAPISILRLIVKLRDWYWWQFCRIWEFNKLYKTTTLYSTIKRKQRILVYAISGMSHAGTEKNLQLMANSLVDDYEVFFMFGVETEHEFKAHILNKKIILLPFTYSTVEIAVPNRIYDMKPRIIDVVRQYQIDCVITASPGYSHYPWNLIRDIPIVLLNIFGAPTLQPNVKAVIYNSQTTRKHAAAWIGNDTRAIVQFAPLLKLPPKNTRELGKGLREKLGIKSEDFVFGRIGRADDGIFDSIGIKAWKQILDEHTNAHFIIMSPPPVLIKIVQQENIPRVHLLPPSGEESEIWAFHGAIDAMAHFRFDGETSGVAIAESLYVGNPIITHRSHIWNAHTEYLTRKIARVVNKDDVKEYAAAMREYMQIKATNPAAWNTMRKQATIVAERNFSPDAYKKITEDIIAKILPQPHDKKKDYRNDT